MKTFQIFLAAMAFFSTSISFAQHHDHGVDLHVNPKWKECSFELDPSLTQQAWHQFTREAALVAYFRPLTDAKPIGQWNVEFAVLQWATAIDDTDAAWNDTFVHPDSTHWLTEGHSLAFPGLTARVGLTERIDLGVYWTKNVNANYGFWSAQLQYNFINNAARNWAASTRLNFSSLYGPEDLRLHVYGVDVIASKEFPAFFKWATVSPYVGLSTYLSNAQETTEKVNLEDEHVLGGQAMIGLAIKASVARLAVEYNVASVNTLSLKIGIGF